MLEDRGNLVRILGDIERASEDTLVLLGNTSRADYTVLLSKVKDNMYGAGEARRFIMNELIRQGGSNAGRLWLIIPLYAYVARDRLSARDYDLATKDYRAAIGWLHADDPDAQLSVNARLAWQLLVSQYPDDDSATQISLAKEIAGDTGAV